MLVIIDGGEAKEVLNDVRIVFGEGKERHVIVTHEGVVVDLIDGGEIVDTWNEQHEDILCWQEDE